MNFDLNTARRRAEIRKIQRRRRIAGHALVVIGKWIAIAAIMVAAAAAANYAIVRGTDFLIERGVELEQSKQVVMAAEIEPAEEIKAPEPKAYKTITTKVTGYNTVPAQTDNTPCIAASGHNICGRMDVAACPRSIPLGTDIEIDGKVYTCLDRLAPKYDHRIDISCDKDMACPYGITGTKQVKILSK